MKLSLVAATETGEIYDDPDLLMVMDRGGQWSLPQTADLMPLPDESELFLLPGRRPVGLDPSSGKICAADGLAVAAFAAPAHTLTAHPAFLRQPDAPMLPLFAYGAVGFAEGKFWLAAVKVDDDPRQKFAGIKPGRIANGARQLLRAYPRNRLVGHIINNCVRRYDCPAARNFALGRYEAPLPTSRACNAACVGCISAQDGNSPIRATPQCRLEFTPTAAEIAEVMAIHESREKKMPIYSFGQGCEGDPLMNHELLCESVRIFRSGKKGSSGKGTINCNTNASNPDAARKLAEAGLTSLRVSLNSAVPGDYRKYYRPANYGFEDVAETMKVARAHGVHVALNLLYFPGFTDTAPQQEALACLCRACGVSMIQLRNLNIDPSWYREIMSIDAENSLHKPYGTRKFIKKMTLACPWLKFGYFNPYLGERAEIDAPMPV